MRLDRLSLKGFRNLVDQVLDFPPEGVAVVGRNAQGKTNLLEAIHYLETFRSFRGARDEQLTRIGGSVFRIEARLGEEGSRLRPSRAPGAGLGAPNARTVAAAYDNETREKRVALDGDAPARIGNAIGALGSILFTPDDVRLVNEGPVERRRFLDILLSLNDPAYLRALQRFRQALARRNAALRRGEQAASVAAWDEGLVHAGAEVMDGRARWIEAHSDRLSDYYREVAGRGIARMRYEPSVVGPAGPSAPPGTGIRSGEGRRLDRAADLKALARSYGVALDATRDQERRLRTTVVGPHRDEVRFFIEAPEGDRDARELASGGERRTIALALRLLEADTVRERRRREPVLLLDDLFAELDDERSRRVLDLLERMVPGQVILTAPKASDVRFRSATLPRWQVREGIVTTS
jgi:DNA replication and repair protein RecF